MNLTEFHNSEDKNKNLILTKILQNMKIISTLRVLLFLLNLLQLSFHTFCPHDTAYNSAQEENESIDEASHSGILTVGTATTQQT